MFWCIVLHCAINLASIWWCFFSDLYLVFCRVKFIGQCRITHGRVTTLGHIIYEVGSSSKSNVNETFVVAVLIFKTCKFFLGSGTLPRPYRHIFKTKWLASLHPYRAGMPASVQASVLLGTLTRELDLCRYLHTNIGPAVVHRCPQL